MGTQAFETIVKQQIKRLEDPSLKCVSLVYDELVRILTGLLGKQLFRRYPSLKEKFHAVVIGFFKKAMDPTNKLVKDLVAMEACYVNTGHPDFLSGHKVGETFRQACSCELIPPQPLSSIVTTKVDEEPESSGRRQRLVTPPKDLISTLFNTAYDSNTLHQKKAMAIVNDRHTAAKPTQVDPKTGRPLPPAVPPRAASPSLDLPPIDNSGFFGSFFPSKNKKKMAAMDSPPPQLKASGALSEKEANEVEVISTSTISPGYDSINVFDRAADQFLFQYHAPYHDRYGP